MHVGADSTLANQNRLEHTISNLDNVVENTTNTTYTNCNNSSNSLIR